MEPGRVGNSPSGARSCYRGGLHLPITRQRTRRHQRGSIRPGPTGIATRCGGPLRGLGGRAWENCLQSQRLLLRREQDGHRKQTASQGVQAGGHEDPEGRPDQGVQSREVLFGRISGAGLF